MPRGLKLQNYSITKLHNPQRGYILITLMLSVALMAIAMLIVLPRMQQQIQRDKEQELCHRGSAYMRAIQHYYKKFGRYPTRIEDLENTNNVRFLRKRYKDPMSRDPQTGKDRDFKILHMQDVTLNNGPVLGQVPGQGGLPGLGGPFGQMPGGPSGLAGAFGQTGQLGGLQRSVSQQPQSGSSDNSDTDNSGNPSANANPGSSGSSSSSSSSSGGSSSSSSSNTGSSSGSGSNQTVFGGGPILGVASISKAQTIREFNKKNHYNDWLFIYDPTSDRGGLLVGPWQTGLTGGLGGSGLGTPVQNLSRPPQGMGPGGILQPVGNQPQSTQQTPQNPPPNQEDNPNQ